MSRFQSYYLVTAGDVVRVNFVGVDDDGRYVYKERRGFRTFYWQNDNFVFDNKREAMVFALGIDEEVFYVNDDGNIEQGQIKFFLVGIKDGRKVLLVAIAPEHGTVEYFNQEPKAVVEARNIRLDDYEVRWIEENANARLHHYHSSFYSQENGQPTPVAMFMEFRPLVYQRLSRKRFRFKKAKGARRFLMSMN